MTKANTKTPLMRVHGISKVLGGREILKSVSLDLYEGEMKVLIGPSGGGKSTLLQCMNYLIVPDRGEIELEGQHVDPNKARELCVFRQHVGMIFQDFNLFDHLTAVDNVSIALRKVRGMSRSQARVRAMAELDRVGLADKGHLYPAELSGGQKQRVSRSIWQRVIMPSFLSIMCWACPVVASVRSLSTCEPAKRWSWTRIIHCGSRMNWPIPMTVK